MRTLSLRLKLVNLVYNLILEHILVLDFRLVSEITRNSHLLLILILNSSAISMLFQLCYMVFSSYFGVSCTRNNRSLLFIEIYYDPYQALSGHPHRLKSPPLQSNDKT
jgi:hypothetical protein